MRSTPWSVWVAAACAVLGTAQAASPCKIVQIAELHVGRRGNSPFVDGQINGQSVSVLLDTGADTSFVTGGAARRLQLRLRDSDQLVHGVNGAVLEQFAVVDQLQIGSFTARDLLLRVIGPGLGRDESDAGFVLGSDFFMHFTTEFDLAHDAIRLLQPHGCKPEQLVYWDQDYFLADLERLGATDASLTTRVLVNGVRLNAELDTGSGLSLISAMAARRAGVTVSDPGVESSDTLTGIAGRSADSWVGRFDTVSIGNETVQNARLRITSLFDGEREPGLSMYLSGSLRHYPEMLLGADFFQAHRIVISPDAHVALFTYAGGKVFQLVRPDVAIAPSAVATP